MPKAQSARTTKTRKNTKKRELNHTAQLELIHDYAKGELNVAKLAAKYDTTEKNVGLITTRFWKELTNMKESRALIAPGSSSSATALRAIQGTDQINTQFLDKLSPDSAQGLTEEESIYAWIYVHTGDTLMAIQEASLDSGIIKGDRDSRHSYDKAMLVRSLYLNTKPNIASYIKDLRERRFIDSDITKSRIQSELLDQLEQLKANPQYNRREILRVIELLGKTVGAFIERIEIGELDPSRALDRLIELSKQQELEVITVETVDAIE